MKVNTRASKSDKNSSIVTKINDFVSLNSFALLLLMLGIWFHQVYVVGDTVKQLEANQHKMVKYLKENVDKVYFLSASGMAITATKSEVSYADERFKSYMLNEIVTKMLAGNIVLSSNYTITYANYNEFVTKNAQVKNFYTRFVKPNKGVLESSLRSLHRAVVEGKYPEYINVLSQKYVHYKIIPPSEETGPQTKIDAKVVLTILVKSWIRDLKRWDTRKMKISIPFSVRIDVAKYANIGNPFGIHFEKLQIPAIHKPTGSQIRDEKR